MVIDVYVDMIFLVNFVANAAVLGLCNILLRRRARLWRLMAGAAVTALFYIVLLFSGFRSFLNVFTSFVVLAPGIAVAFGVLPWRARDRSSFFVNLGAAYVCVFAMGGLATVIAGNVGMAEVAVVAAVVAAFAGIRFVRVHVAAKMLDKKSFCDVAVCLGDLSVSMRALVDTGNSLVEPISQKPVIVAELAALRGILPDAVSALFDKGEQNDLAAIAQSFEEAGLQNRIRMVPFRSLGDINGVLIGFRPDGVVVGDGSVKDVIIGICDFRLSEDGEYAALVNPVLMS